MRVYAISTHKWLLKCFVCATIQRMLIKKKKQKIIKNSQKHEKDTGSPEVQIAVLSKQIDELASHLKKHHKDNHSRKGLLQMVADRHKHIRYLKRKDENRYVLLAKKIGLKVKK